MAARIMRRARVAAQKLSMLVTEAMKDAHSKSVEVRLFPVCKNTTRICVRRISSMHASCTWQAFLHLIRASAAVAIHAHGCNTRHAADCEHGACDWQASFRKCPAPATEAIWGCDTGHEAEDEGHGVQAGAWRRRKPLWGIGPVSKCRCLVCLLRACRTRRSCMHQLPCPGVPAFMRSLPASVASMLSAAAGCDANSAVCGTGCGARQQCNSVRRTCSPAIAR